MTTICNNNIKLSLVIPVRNGIRFILDTLRSLENLEKILSCELIFQNCQSTDGTTEVLEQFCLEKENRHHFNEKDSGQSDAINVGVSRAKGKWVTWLCADDIILPDLSFILKEAENVKADIVYGDIIFVHKKNVFPAIGTEVHDEGALAKRRLIIQQPGTCILRSTWEEFGGVRLHLNWTMDYDLFMRLESADKIFLRSKYFVAIIRIHKEAKTSSGSVKRVFEYWKIIFESHCRRPAYFRIRPYLVYGVEYLIKALESTARLQAISPVPSIIRMMHKFFWLIASPREQGPITERFNKLPSSIKNIIAG